MTESNQPGDRGSDRWNDEYKAGRAFERRFGDRAHQAADEQQALREGRFAERRSWLTRTRDEVASWFGDVGALRRRQWDLAAGDHTGQGPAVEVDPDTRIAEELASRLSQESRLDASGVHVAVAAGLVDLSGTVTILADRHLAEEIAWSIAGVSGVTNHLTVG